MDPAATFQLKRTSAMKWFLYLISVVWIGTGCCAILYTQETTTAVRQLIQGTGQKTIAFLPFFFGILLLFSASASFHPWVIRILGLIAVSKGIFFFTNPKNMGHKVVDWYTTSVSEQTNRLFGIIMLMLGTAVLSWIQ